MARIPEYTTSVPFSLPATPVYIQNSNSAFWDNMSAQMFAISDKGFTEAGQAQGVEAQQARGSAENNVAPDGILGAVARLTPFGKGFTSGADQIWATQKQMQLTDKVSEIQKQFPGDADGFRTAYDTAKKDWLKDTRPDLLPQMAGYADQVGERNYSILQREGVLRQKETQAVSALNDFDKLRTEIYDGILSGKLDQTTIDEKQAQATNLLKGAVDAGYLTPMQARQQTEIASFNTKQAEIMKAFRANPSAGFVEAIKNSQEKMQHGGGTPFTPEQRERLGSKLDGELNQMISRARAAEAGANAQVKAQFNDHIAQLTTTGEGILSDDQIKLAFAKNPQVQKEALAQSAIARDTFTFNQSIGLTSPAEDTARLQKLMPQPGDTAYANRLQAYGRAQTLVANKWQQVESDPGQYVLSQSPEIRSMISSEDPSTRSMGYATMREVQTRMGVSPGNISVMPNTAAKQYVQEIQAAPPEDAANKIASIAQQFGDNYPSVAKQFAKNGLNPAYQVLASLVRPEDAQTRVDLAKALSMGNDLKDNLDKRDKTLVSTIDQRTQEGLNDFTRTAMAQGDPRLVKTVNDAATFLAYYYASRPGTDANTAAKEASLAMTRRWDFLGDMRVPKGMTAPVETVTEEVRAKISPDMLRPVPARPGEVLTEEQRLGIQTQQAKRGRWVTNEDGSGVLLLYPNGQPVYVKSESARKEPTVQPGDPSNVDSKTGAKALRNKTNVQGNELNAERVEAARQGVVDQRQSTGGSYRRVELKFSDIPALAKRNGDKAPLSSGEIYINPEALR